MGSEPDPGNNSQETNKRQIGALMPTEDCTRVGQSPKDKTTPPPAAKSARTEIEREVESANRVGANNRSQHLALDARNTPEETNNHEANLHQSTLNLTPKPGQQKKWLTT